MVSAILIVAFVCMVILYAYEYARHRPKNFPPGPFRVPLFGSYIFFLLIDFKSTHRVAMLLSKWFKSKTLGFYLGKYPTVVVHSREGVKEVLSRPEFDGRPDLFASRFRDPNMIRNGISFQEGPIWKTQKRFILRYLRDFGFGRRFDELENAINEELRELLDVLSNGPKFAHEDRFHRKNQALCPYFMTPLMVNAFLKTACNERIPRVDQSQVGDVALATEKFQRTGDDYGRLISLLPWVRFLFPKASGYTDLKNSNDIIYNFIKSIVDRHVETFNPDHIRNFIDMYIDEMYKEKANREFSTFAIDQFVLSLLDFMVPVTASISTQLSFLFQWFLLKPEIQKRVQSEIDEVVGRGRLPSLDDRQYMHYTEATLRECLRVETLVPSSIPHRTLVETDLLGYCIPADTTVFTGLYGYHHDKEVWGDPEQFRPERFLDSKGHFSVKKDFSFPFGGGRRLCPGETFSRNMLFLTITTVCQNFNIVLGEGEPLPDLNKTMCGVIRSPPDFWVTLEIR